MARRCDARSGAKACGELALGPNAATTGDSCLSAMSSRPCYRPGVKSSPVIHHRQSIRLQQFDYRSSGAYFVTICTFQRECILDAPNVSEIVRQSWRSATHRGPDPSDFIVMPNHVHGIIWTTRTAVGAQRPGKLNTIDDGTILGQTITSESEGATPYNVPPNPRGISRCHCALLQVAQRPAHQFLPRSARTPRLATQLL
jgi:hypothetical protein